METRFNEVEEVVVVRREAVYQTADGMTFSDMNEAIIHEAIYYLHQAETLGKFKVLMASHGIITEKCFEEQDIANSEVMFWIGDNTTGNHLIDLIENSYHSAHVSISRGLRFSDWHRNKVLFLNTQNLTDGCYHGHWEILMSAKDRQERLEAHIRLENGKIEQARQIEQFLTNG